MSNLTPNPASSQTALAGRRILLGVSGSIAAYKAADLCSQFGKRGADVHVVLTPSAAQFIGAATLRALTRNPVVIDVFDEPTDRRIAHIDLAQSADLVLVAPASADILAKMAHGLADDMLSTCLLATPPTTPLLVAPAMNTVMWEHPATVANVKTLQDRGVHLISPDYGLLACQDVGTGKLAAVDDIVSAVCTHLSAVQDWAGLRLLVTAGATREPLDPVRFLSNRSSGKMGYAIALEAALRGAHVTLISGFSTVPVPSATGTGNAAIEFVRVETAAQMFAACRERFPQVDAVIAAAAVADYAPETISQHKLKKPALDEQANGEIPDERDQSITLRLKRTPDIVATLGRLKKPGQVVIGFAAETEDLLIHARTKLESKRLDLIVANDVLAEGAGFEGDTNIVTLVWPDGRSLGLPKMLKPDVARHLLGAVRTLLHDATPSHKSDVAIEHVS